MNSNREMLAAFAGLIVIILAFFALSELLKEISTGDVRAAVRAISIHGWLAALALTVISYACLTIYDYAALRVIGADLGYPVAARAAATSYAISNTLGLSLLTGGSIRLRIYSSAGLAKADVARVVALASATFWSGIFVLFALSMLITPDGIQLGSFRLPTFVQWAIPIPVVASVLAFLVWSARKPRSLTVFGATMPLPQPKLAIALLAAAAIDLAASAAIIFVLMPNLSADVYPQLLGAYILALGVAVLTHSPGGLGVFETMVLLTLPQLAKSDLAAALIGYRLIYYILPFVIAVLVLAITEGNGLRKKTVPVIRAGHSAIVSLAPLAMAAAVFAGGALLIVSGAFPAVPDRVEALVQFVPPALLDLSHFVSSVVGTVLMFVAYGLFRRLDIAWFTAMGLLALGVLATLLRGFDYVEASVLSAVLLILAWTRPAFYRQSAMSGEGLGAGWLLAIAAVLCTSIFLGFHLYRNVEYRNELWWQIHPAGDTQRFFRASLGASLLGLFLALRRLTLPGQMKAPEALPEAVWLAALAHSDSAEAHLARTNDKWFLSCAEGDAFLMYRVRGRSFIVMGDPVGAKIRWRGLVWQLLEMADKRGGRVVFYECGADFLPLAVDLGLGVMKLGEEALVPLANFSLAGKARSDLRQATNRMERDGVTFRLVEGESLSMLMPQLRAVSDQWLAEKKQKEKQFSLGRFEPDYLLGTPVGIVERNGRVLAFANLWPLPNKSELSFDLMRHSTNAPSGTMDFLFAQLMLWGRDQGYQHLSLGVAPLSGIENRRLAPFWARAAGAFFSHGERVYGYAGLRRYKEKFHPEWKGRYLAAPRGLATALALIDVTLLISAPAVRIPGAKLRVTAEDGESPSAVPESDCAAHPATDQASVASPISRSQTED